MHLPVELLGHRIPLELEPLVADGRPVVHLGAVQGRVGRVVVRPLDKLLEAEAGVVEGVPGPELGVVLGGEHLAGDVDLGRDVGDLLARGHPAAEDGLEGLRAELAGSGKLDFLLVLPEGDVVATVVLLAVNVPQDDDVPIVGDEGQVVHPIGGCVQLQEREVA